MQLSEAVDKQAIAIAAGNVLGINAQDLLAKMEEPPEGIQYLVLDNYVEASQAAELRQLQQTGVALAAPGQASRLRGLELTAAPTTRLSRRSARLQRARICKP